MKNFLFVMTSIFKVGPLIVVMKRISKLGALIVSIAMLFSVADAHAEKSFDAMVRELKKSLDAGDPDAAAILADLRGDDFFYQDTSGFARFDRGQWKSLVEKSFKAGSAFGIYVYGYCLQSGVYGFERNEAEGKALVSEVIPRLRELAKNGNSFACLDLAYIYMGQSNEGVQMEESQKWLVKGMELGNPICTYTLCERILTSSNDQKEIDAALMKLGDLYSVSKIVRDKICRLYAGVIGKRFSDLKFDHLGCQPWNQAWNRRGVFSVFRNEQFQFNLTFVFPYDEDKSLIDPVPSFSIAFKERVGSESKRNVFMTQLLEYQIGRNDLIEMMDAYRKVVEWTNKARDLKPEAFQKGVPRSEGGQGESVTFYWDGISNTRCSVSNSGALDFSVFGMLVDVGAQAADVDNDKHQFYKITKASFEKLKKSVLDQKNLIDNNFK